MGELLSSDVRLFSVKQKSCGGSKHRGHVLAESVQLHARVHASEVMSDTLRLLRDSSAASRRMFTCHALLLEELSDGAQSWLLDQGNSDLHGPADTLAGSLGGRVCSYLRHGHL